VSGSADPKPPRSFVKDNALSLLFFGLFLATLVGQAFAGLADFNEQLRVDGVDPVTMSRYLTSSSFVVDVAENWQSEYLQFTLFIFATVWLVQRGSPESKQPGEEGTESDKQQLVGRHARDDSPAWARVGGLRRAIYSRSLGLLMLTLFLLSWVAQAIAGWSAYGEEQLRQLHAPASFLEYLTRPDFWNRTFQNWQSEFLAVASMAVFAIYLRQRGSPESKPVGAPHATTSVEG